MDYPCASEESLQPCSAPIKFTHPPIHQSTYVKRPENCRLNFYKIWYWRVSWTIVWPFQFWFGQIPCIEQEFTWRVSSSGMWSHVVCCVATDVSEEHIACHLLACWFLQKLFLLPWRWRRYVPPKRRLQLNRLHGVTSQKMILFITTAVKTSNPTRMYLFRDWKIKLKQAVLIMVMITLSYSRNSCWRTSLVDGTSRRLANSL
jgi:hypothetical protein